MARSKTAGGVVGGVINALAGGGMFAVAKSGFDHLDPFHLVAARFAVAAIVFVALLAMKEGISALRFDGRILKIWWLGTIGFAGFNLFVYVGLQTIPSQSSALVIATMPALTVLAIWARSKKRPHAATLGFVALALFGVALVLGNGNPLSVVTGGVGFGGLLTLVGAAGWVIYSTGAAANFPDWSPLRYTTLTCLLGTVSILVITAVSSLAGWIPSAEFEDYTASWWQILYMAIPASVIAMLGWFTAIRDLGPANGALFVNLVPVTAFVVQAFLGHVPTGPEIAGICLVLGALIASNFHSRSRTAKAAAAAGQPQPIDSIPVPAGK
ncbi:DMT family transporter [Streptomyces sp. NBC_00335]|uniref:DMT family transporter n=1 Tax=unclassified Streptomyces TaxID=2593676 RepID=UPI00225600A8|nr:MULTISPECIES: DMT family transporter [unclassified Streptomyces]MCX5406593.1 DMT family transporter [Streptomyces sp. NBC_00086]